MPKSSRSQGMSKFVKALKAIPLPKPFTAEQRAAGARALRNLGTGTGGELKFRGKQRSSAKPAKRGPR